MLLKKSRQNPAKRFCCEEEEQRSGREAAEEISRRE